LGWYNGDGGQKMEWHRINWKGPYSIDKATEVAESEDFGFYAIYETTHEPRLLYIGKTYMQDFDKCLMQHRREWLGEISGTMGIHFGIIKLLEGKKLSPQNVDDIEECLLYIYRPPYNMVNKEGYTGRDILIINTGKVGTIKKLVSNDTKLLALLQ
jgi:hypothetical protein